LREAARLVNGGISTSKVTVSSQTAKAMQAVDLPSVAKAIPAGLGNDLLTGTMLVYSELVSRSDSMSLFRFPAIYDRQHVDPHTAPNADQMLVCLSHGVPGGASLCRRPEGLGTVRAEASAGRHRRPRRHERRLRSRSTSLRSTA